MNVAMAFLISIALGVLVSVIAFPGRVTGQIAALMALLAFIIVGIVDAENSGGENQFTRLFDPLANGFARIIGMPGNPISDNPCPADANPGRYGDAARYDGILITGSPEFVGRVVTALNRLYETPSYRFARELRHIEERELRPGRWAEVSGRHTLVTPKAARRSCTFLAGTIAHEGAHVVYGSDHGPVYAAQARALREMGELRAAVETERLASNY